MPSNPLPLLPCRLTSVFRHNTTSCFSINPTGMITRLSLSTSYTFSCINEAAKKPNQTLEQECVSLNQFFEQAKDFVTSDVGPPLWFSPLDCRHPLPDSPLLLFLPGIDGTGLGLIRHHQKLGRSPLQHILPLLQSMPDLSNLGLPHLLSSMAGVLMADLEKGAGRLLRDLVEPSISNLSVLADILTIETLLWKLKMINSASFYANLCLRAVKAQTLILSSGKDPFLPSQEEGQRLKQLLPCCGICTFEDSGHFLFLDDALDLVTVIKQAGIYRRSKERDFVSDYIPPSPSELTILQHKYRWLNIMSPVMFSSFADGKIVRGFAGIPSEGPVIYVGNHQLLGFDVFPLIAQFLKQRDINLRGIAHPLIFMNMIRRKLSEPAFAADMRHLGAVPVSGKIMFKLLSTKSHILLYPGGVREALHRGEEYKLYWPEQTEFVRMAARLGAKIIPFGAVGEGDWAHVTIVVVSSHKILFDHEDQIKVPFLEKYIDELTDEARKVRATIDEEEGNQDLHLPGILPKFPGRFYYHFGKPIDTEGRKQELRDNEKAHELYLQVKSEVKNSVAYLIEKRESDPYRSLGARLLFHAANGFTAQVPTFDID